MRVAALYFLLATGIAACTTVLGDDFEIVTDTASTTVTASAASSTSSSMGGETSAGGSAGMSAGGNGSGGAGGEDCTNGIDDDNDMLLDCADDECMGPYQCIPPIPSSWTGPIALSEVPKGTPKPTCPSGYPSEHYNGILGIHADAVSCGNCTCPATNPICTANGIGHYTQANCAQFPFAGTNTIGGCAQQGSYPGTISVKIGFPSASVTCTAQGGGIVNTPPIDWDAESRACAYTGMLGGGCMNQEVCAPLTGGGMFNDRVCILKAGDEICPSGFPNKLVYSDSANGYMDTRSCSQCGCMQQSASCSVSTQFFSSSNCTGSPVFTIANNNTCNSSNINGLYAKGVITGQPSGSCSVTQQSTPQGSVTATGPFTTVCCLP